MISSLISLKNSPTWDPAILAKHTIQWPNKAKIVRLGDVSQGVSPFIWVKRGAQVITSSSVDVRYGHVFQRSRNFEGTGFQVSDGSNQLSVGDILIPFRLDVPVLLLNYRHSGAFVSDEFFALKMITLDWATWLWAVLNSSIGMKLRAAYLADSTTRISKIRCLLDLPIPIVPPRSSTLWDELLQIEESTHRSEIEAVETWWRIAQLNSTNWAYELGAGRKVPLTSRVSSAQLGSFPYVDGKYLSGGSIHSWATEGLIADPGDVLIAGVGYRSNARIATERMIAGTDIYVLRLKEPHLATALTAYLNGQEGYDQRQLRISGKVIPRVSLRDLEQLGVNEFRLREPNADIHSSVDLASRLDAALWC